MKLLKTSTSILEVYKFGNLLKAKAIYLTGELSSEAFLIVFNISTLHIFITMFFLSKSSRNLQSNINKSQLIFTNKNDTFGTQ